MVQRKPKTRRPPAASPSVASPSVEQAIGRIQAYYRLGQSRPRGSSGRVKYGHLRELAKEDPAQSVGRQEKERKARAFANAYGEADLNTLCEMCRAHSCALGITHIDRLVRVPTARRQAIQKRVVAQHWSRRHLDAEIYRLYEAEWKREAGHPWNRPQNANQARYDLYRLCSQWGRLYKVLLPSGGIKKHRRAWDKLPSRLQRAVREANAHMEKLERLLDAR